MGAVKTMEEFGFCLDAINGEAIQQVFSEGLIDEMYCKSLRLRKEFNLREQKKGE